MGREGPYPIVGGRYVIRCSDLPAPLRHALAHAAQLHSLAEESQRKAEEWSRIGVNKVLVEGRRELASVFARGRDCDLAKLWTFHGLRPPEDLSFGTLDIIGEVDGRPDP